MCDDIITYAMTSSARHIINNYSVRLACFHNFRNLLVQVERQMSEYGEDDEAGQDARDGVQYDHHESVSGQQHGHIESMKGRSHRSTSFVGIQVLYKYPLSCVAVVRRPLSFYL